MSQCIATPLIISRGASSDAQLHPMESCAPASFFDQTAGIHCHSVAKLRRNVSWQLSSCRTPRFPLSPQCDFPGPEFYSPCLPHSIIRSSLSSPLDDPPKVEHQALIQHQLTTHPCTHVHQERRSSLADALRTRRSLLCYLFSTHSPVNVTDNDSHTYLYICYLPLPSAPPPLFFMFFCLVF